MLEYIGYQVKRSLITPSFYKAEITWLSHTPNDKIGCVTSRLIAWSLINGFRFKLLTNPNHKINSGASCWIISRARDQHRSETKLFLIQWAKNTREKHHELRSASIRWLRVSFVFFTSLLSIRSGWFRSISSQNLMSPLLLPYLDYSAIDKPSLSPHNECKVRVER